MEDDPDPSPADHPDQYDSLASVRQLAVGMLRSREASGPFPPHRSRKEGVYARPVAPLPPLGSVQRVQLHPAANRGVCTGIDEKSSHLERAIARDLSQRRVTDPGFVSRVNVCSGFDQVSRHFEVLFLRGPMKCCHPQTVERIDIRTRREETFDQREIPVLSREVEPLVLVTFSVGHGA
jgi:hypothetical protein